MFQWKSLYWGHSNLGYFSNNRSNPLERFYKIWVLKGFANFTGKHMYHILFFIKLQAEDLQFYYKRNFRTSVFLWILQNFYRHLFTEHLWLTTSGIIILYFVSLVVLLFILQSSTAFLLMVLEKLIRQRTFIAVSKDSRWVEFKQLSIIFKTFHVIQQSFYPCVKNTVQQHNSVNIYEWGIFSLSDKSFHICFGSICVALSYLNV